MRVHVRVEAYSFDFRVLQGADILDDKDQLDVGVGDIAIAATEGMENG